MKEGYYYLTSERSSYRSIVQFINGNWFAIGESKPLTLEELNLRGWEVDGFVENMGYDT